MHSHSTGPSGPSAQIQCSATPRSHNHLAARLAWLLPAASLSALVACGGGGGAADTGSRSGVSVKQTLSATPRLVQPGESVTYAVECSGSGAMSYEWNPGDGSELKNTTEPKFTHTYKTPDKVQPRVTCIDGRKARATSALDGFVVVALPMHAITNMQIVSTERGATNTVVTFSATCVGSRSDSTLTYSWDFGDKSPAASSSTVTHSYPNSPANQYTATVRCNEAIVLDSISHTGTVTVQQGVTASTAVTIDAVVSTPKVDAPLRAEPSIPTTAGPASFSMACTPTTSDATVSYQFNFGDGSPVLTSTTGSATHSYLLAQPYTATASCKQGSAPWGPAQQLNLDVRTPTLSLLAGKDPGAIEIGSPLGIAVDSSGNLFVADFSQHAILKVTAAGIVSTFAGTSDANGVGVAGLVDGVGTAAAFHYPRGITVDSADNLYVADSGNNAIRKITSQGVVSTVAGDRGPGYVDGTGAGARFRAPVGIAVDRAGNVFVADSGNHAIRKITSGGAVTTIAGLPVNPSGLGTSGFANGSGVAASFNYPTAITIDPTGNLFVVDFVNNVIRQITSLGQVTTVPGTVNASGVGTTFIHPDGIAVDSAGNIFVADSGSYTIRKITAAGVVSTFAGSTKGFANGTGTNASFSGANAMTVDATGNFFLAETNANYMAIRKITSAAVVSTVYGTTGFTNGTGAAASFNVPSSSVFDAAGNLFVADSGNNAIRKITTAGVVSTFASDVSVAGGTARAGSFDPLRGLAIDSAGSLFVSDYDNKVIRKITTAGVVSTFATSFNGPKAITIDSKDNLFVVDDAVKMVTPQGVITTPPITWPSTSDFNPCKSVNGFKGITVDSAGNLFVVDGHAICKITAKGEVSAIAGSGSGGVANGTGTTASFYFPSGITIDSAGNLYVADRDNSAIRKITPAGIVSTVVGKARKSALQPGALPGTIGRPRGIAIQGRRLVFTADNYIAQVDYAP